LLISTQTSISAQVENYFFASGWKIHYQMEKTGNHEVIYHLINRSLNHTNILTVYEVGKHENYLFIAMEYIEGESLDELISQKQLSIQKVLEIAVQICKGMDAAHRNEIIHRDIKPENILIENSGQVKLVDFGLAKLKNMNQLTKASSALGTLSYMSPEQIQNMDVDKRSDIFSFGVVLYQMITGNLPFEGEYEAATTYSIVNDDPEPLEHYKSGLSNQFQHVVDKCLSKDRNNRYQNAGEILADLNEISQESEKNIRVSSKRKFTSRRPLLLGLSLILFISALLFFTLKFFNVFQIDNPIPEKKVQNQFQNSVAVLPFENMSSDPEQEYFCDGMTEQIITNLSQLEKLKVIARTSVMKFKDTKKTIPEIADELGVATILEGSIRKYGNRVRVTAQLVQTDQVYNLWENDYDIDMQDLFAVQDEVSEEIAEKLLNKLTIAEEKNLKTEEPKNVDSYEYYLRGVYFLKKKYWITRKLEDFLESEKMFKRAIEYDSAYALAYAGLADLYNEVDIYNSSLKKDSNDYIDLQEYYIIKAYNLDLNYRLL
jgi:serine/threonine protein kinase